jgi:hypothetical protein
MAARAIRGFATSLVALDVAPHRYPKRKTAAGAFPSGSRRSLVRPVLVLPAGLSLEGLSPARASWRGY